MIELFDLHFSYHKVCRIDIPKLTLDDGSLTVLVGENGSGKTTLLRLIAGELRTAQGRILVDGQDMARLPKKQLAKRLSYFPQGRPTPDMSALEVTALGRYPHTRTRLFSPKEDREWATRALVSAGAEPFAERNMRTLSFGERQRVYLAMQLAQDAQNCLLDEPANFLDVSAQFSMLDTLSALRKKEKCILCVVHDLSLAMRCADRILVMKNGTVMADGTPDRLYESGAIDQVFGIRLCRSERDGEIFYGILP